MMKKINGYINNYEEACLVVHASRLGALARTTERLNAEERESIESGSIFCFIENENGMKRWTDGRIWSPSKISGEFLLYQEVPRHLSKNSIKKRKEVERVLDNVGGAGRRSRHEDTIDRTTMHKKTVCIRHGNSNYHIIAYYRPIFANSSLADLEYFRRLSAALSSFPELKNDEHLRKERMLDDGFYKKYGLKRDVEDSMLDSGKRVMLESMALEVLITLGKNSYKRGRRLLFQSD